MNAVSFVVELHEDARYRVRFEAQKGKVQEFVVQLEFRVGSEWRPVIRYDTAHGHAHSDRYDPAGKRTPHQPMPVSDYNQALTYALVEVKERWQQFIRPFREAFP